MNSLPPDSPPVRPLFRRTLWLGGGAVLLGLLAVWGWRWYARPPLPRLALEGLDPVVVEAVNRELNEVKRNRGSGTAWGRLGMVLMVHSLHAEAAECLTHAARLEPDEPRWPYLRGVQLTVEEPERSLPYLRRAVELVARKDRLNTAPHCAWRKRCCNWAGSTRRRKHIARSREEPTTAGWILVWDSAPWPGRTSGQPRTV